MPPLHARSLPLQYVRPCEHHTRVPKHDIGTSRLQRLDPAALVKLRREALVCAIIGFPLLLLVAAGFDLGFVLSSFHPNLTVYLGLENVMPAYNAYRILVEVVLEALPQVRLRSPAGSADLFSRFVFSLRWFDTTRVSRSRRRPCFESVCTRKRNVPRPPALCAT